MVGQGCSVMEIKPLRKPMLQVLLALFETRSGTIKGYVLYKKYPNIAAQMVEEEWLVEDGILPSVEDDGFLTSVEWNAKLQKFQYFSSLLGWTTISTKWLKRYKINMKQVGYWLFDFFSIHASSQPTMLYKDILAYMGVTKIDSEIVNIYLCSRLNNLENRESISHIMNKREKLGKSLMIIGKVGSKIPMNLPANVTEVKFESLLSEHNEICQIDRDCLSFIIAHQSQRIEPPGTLLFSEDYRTIHWRGITYRFTKLQADIFEALWKVGGYAHKDYLQAQANTNTQIHRAMRNNVNGKFVPHPLMGALILSENNGYYRLNEEVDINAQQGLFIEE